DSGGTFESGLARSKWLSVGPGSVSVAVLPVLTPAGADCGAATVGIESIPAVAATAAELSSKNPRRETCLCSFSRFMARYLVSAEVNEVLFDHPSGSAKERRNSTKGLAGRHDPRGTRFFIMLAITYGQVDDCCSSNELPATCPLGAQMKLDPSSFRDPYRDDGTDTGVVRR